MVNQPISIGSKGKATIAVITNDTKPVEVLSLNSSL